AASKISAVVPDTISDAAWVRQRLRPLVGLDAPPVTTEENFAAWRAFLESLAFDRPSVFVFDDLHWADEAFLGFLEQLADGTASVPMLLATTARRELYERMPGWAMTARNANRINLSPLTDEETARLVAYLVASSSLPAEVYAAVLQRAGGNPFFAEEFVRLLRDQGILASQISAPAIERRTQNQVPPAIEGIISARLDTLSPDQRRLLRDAAVVGEIFWSGALSDMGGVDGLEVRHALHDLSRTEL